MNGPRSPTGSPVHLDPYLSGRLEVGFRLRRESDCLQDEETEDKRIPRELLAQKLGLRAGEIGWIVAVDF